MEDIKEVDHIVAIRFVLAGNATSLKLLETRFVFPVRERRPIEWVGLVRLVAITITGTVANTHSWVGIDQQDEN